MAAVHATRGLLTALLDLAADRDPEGVSLRLSSTPAGEFADPLDLDPDTPVLTHFTPSAVGASVNAVFGVDVGTPPGRGGARFVSHPDGDPGLSEADDLAAVVLVAVPPFGEGDVAAVDREGRPVALDVVDAEPPEETLPE